MATIIVPHPKTGEPVKFEGLNMQQIHLLQEMAEMITNRDIETNVPYEIPFAERIQVIWEKRRCLRQMKS